MLKDLLLYTRVAFSVISMERYGRVADLPTWMVPLFQDRVKGLRAASFKGNTIRKASLPRVGQNGEPDGHSQDSQPSSGATPRDITAFAPVITILQLLQRAHRVCKHGLTQYGAIQANRVFIRVVVSPPGNLRSPDRHPGPIVPNMF